jgi:hypothetical protein
MVVTNDQTWRNGFAFSSEQSRNTIIGWWEEISAPKVAGCRLERQVGLSRPLTALRQRTPNCMSGYSGTRD